MTRRLWYPSAAAAGAALEVLWALAARCVHPSKRLRLSGMLPIAETSRARRWPAVTYVLLLANLFMFGYELSLGKQLEPFIDLWGMVPASVAGLVAGDEAHAGVLVT
ncbi:MAG: hypothetical protein IT307_09645, partial [Chloroflexi bacterium]|nr:hypothetical protein [Chloroflexota bacterium]